VFQNVRDSDSATHLLVILERWVDHEALECVAQRSSLFHPVLVGSVPASTKLHILDLSFGLEQCSSQHTDSTCHRVPESAGLSGAHKCFLSSSDVIRTLLIGVTLRRTDPQCENQFFKGENQVVHSEEKHPTKCDYTGIINRQYWPFSQKHNKEYKYKL
jgi:hypothetical protein